MTPPLLAAERVSFAHERGRPVLAGAGLAVRAGDRLAVLGRNGGGKTTLLRLLAGSLRPDDGAVLLGGHPVSYGRAGLTALRSRVQLVLQEPDDQLFAPTVYQDVSYGPVNLGLPEPEVRARVAGALAALDVAHLAQRPPHLLSYGERKRVAVAGAVAMRPEVLLLDEPTAGLDPAGVDRLVALLDRLAAGGTTVVLATHDVDLAARWALDAAVVVDGTVVRGPVAEVLAARALVARAGLTSPWAPHVAALLRRLGIEEPVRTADELAAVLAGLAQAVRVPGPEEG